jgi:hypothetical protein
MQTGLALIVSHINTIRNAGELNIAHRVSRSPIVNRRKKMDEWKRPQMTELAQKKAQMKRLMILVRDNIASVEDAFTIFESLGMVFKCEEQGFPDKLNDTTFYCGLDKEPCDVPSNWVHRTQQDMTTPVNGTVFKRVLVEEK